MSRRSFVAATATTVIIAPAAFAGGWVDFDNETSTRMPSALNTPSLGTSDPEEKDYAWGDVDQDGDIDLVVVRKQPFTSTGKKINVLFMNEGIAEGHAINGVFVDRTSQWATASDVAGDNGFNTPTNDRDVQLADLNGDGWLDMVTATTLTDNQAKHLSHPRVYINLGEVAGNWLGFRYEDARIPEMHPTAGPRFCSVAVGDVTGDGSPDLYFGDYDSGGAQIFDYNNKLLVNDGNGFFSDQTNSRLTSQMRESAFGAASEIADFNGDGVDDVLKQTSLANPTHIAVTYNDDGNEGVFDFYDTIYTASGYFVSIGDLNSDGLLDIVITDDGTDRYLLNQGNDGSGHANWLNLSLPSGPSAGFGGNSIIRDLNKDGHADTLITDVDVDIAGCGGRMHIYRNLGDTPNVSFQEQGQVIPNSMLTGTHDVAVFDINGDTWDDLIIGRCSGTQIWMNQPPTGVTYSYTGGLPQFVAPNETTEVIVGINPIGGNQVDDGTIRVHYAIGDGAFTEATVTPAANNRWSAILPAAPCTESIRFYFSASLMTGEEFLDPPAGPAGPYTTNTAEGVEVTFRDEIEMDVSSWTIENDASLTSGAWEQADPNGTITADGLAAPENDATNGIDNVQAFVTENGPEGGAAGANDIDGGPTRLVSPVIDLAGTDATISYSRWFYSDDAGIPGSEDFLDIEVTNNGTDWTLVESIGGTGNDWQQAAFVVGDFVTPTSTVQVRFTASDHTTSPQTSIVEAGIDNFQVEEFLCGDISTCPGDLNGDNSVGFIDLNLVLAAWGPCVGCPEDSNGDDNVGFIDLNDLLAVWGACP